MVLYIQQNHHWVLNILFQYYKRKNESLINLFSNRIIFNRVQKTQFKDSLNPY